MSRTNLAGPLLARLWGEGRVADLPDSALIDRFLAGDGEAAGAAFEVLMARHGPMVLAVCRASLRDRPAAEDAFQATFTVLVRRAHALRRPDRLGPWLHGVALRASKEAARRARRVTPSDPTAEPVDGSPGPAECLSRREDLAALHEEIGRLPESYRAPIVLCDLQGLSHQAAASRLGTTPGAVAVRVHRARKLLRDRLARRGVGASMLGPVGQPVARLVEAVGGGASTARTVLARASRPGPVDDSAAQIAQGLLTTMRVNIALKSALVVLILAASTALAGHGLAARPGPEPPVPPPKPPATPAVARATAVDPPAKPEPKPTFDPLYRLGPGEILKRVPPPYPADRDARLKALDLSAEGPKSVIITQLDDGAPPRLKWTACFASDASNFMSFKGLLQMLLNVDSFSQVKVDGTPAPTAPGDWIVRQGARRDEVLAALNAILRTQVQPPLRVAVRPSDDDRDVIVARGRYARTLITTGDPKNDADNDRIILYDAPSTRMGYRRVGTFEQFLFEASDYLHFEPRRLIISEAQGVPDGLVGWQAHDDGPPQPAEHAVNSLTHLTRQTGLRFAFERRPIPVYHVERAGP